MPSSRLYSAVAVAIVGIGSIASHSYSQSPSVQTVVIEKQAYDRTDLGPFSPSGAIYFMDGASEATVKIKSTGETLTFSFTDQSTSIAASAPTLFNSGLIKAGMFVPVPPPLRPLAHYPLNTPERFTRRTVLHLMQVVSMNMKDSKSGARLLIGLPYADRYPEIFFNSKLFPSGAEDASSFGVVQALMENQSGSPDQVRSTGYPARSFFGIYHILETPKGTFFNKKATQMELQPNKDGKFALTLPPIPFNYSLINDPIPLYDIKNPTGEPVAEIIAAHHESSREATRFSPDSWPVQSPDLHKVEEAIKRLNQQQ
jgi:hypothetical protein